MQQRLLREIAGLFLMAIKELFLATVLALPVECVPDHGGYQAPKDDRKFFWREYQWLKDLLEREYPGNEFMILPVKHQETPPGWTWVPFGWRGHLIYRRPLGGAA